MTESEFRSEGNGFLRLPTAGRVPAGTPIMKNLVFRIVEALFGVESEVAPRLQPSGAGLPPPHRADDPLGRRRLPSRVPAKSIHAGWLAPPGKRSETKMRKLFAILAAGSLLTFGGPAQAASVPTTATLGVAITGLAPITFSGSGSVTVTGSTIIVPAGLVSLSAKITVPVTGVSAVAALRLKKGVGNQAGTFRPGGITSQAPGEICPGTNQHPLGNGCNLGGNIGGLMGLTGSILVIITPMTVTIPVNLNAALLGQGGSTNIPFEIDAAGWTAGTGIVNTANNSFAFNGGLSPLTLVTPTFVSALGNLLPIIGSFTIQALSIPEPGALLLIGTGIAGLVLLGRRQK